MRSHQFVCRPRPEHESLLIQLFRDGIDLESAWNDWLKKYGVDLHLPGVYELHPLLFRHFIRSRRDIPYLEVFRDSHTRVLARNRQRLTEVSLLVEDLEATGIQCLLFKGMSLIPFFENDLALPTDGGCGSSCTGKIRNNNN